MRLKKVISTLFWIVLIYAVVVGWLYFTQRALIYFPDTQKPISPKSVEEFSVQTEDGLEITGWYIEGQKNKPVILYFHGNALSHADRLPTAFIYAAQGYSVLLAGYRGYGGNPGSPSEEGFYEDARAYLKVLKEKGYQNSDIILYGESLGSGVAVQMAYEEKSFRALILEAPYTSIVDVAATRFFWVPVRYLMKDRYDSYSKISEVKTPLIILHGRRDLVINYRFGQKLYEKAGKPKEFLTFDKAGHNDLYVYGAAERIFELIQ